MKMIPLAANDDDRSSTDMHYDGLASNGQEYVKSFTDIANVSACVDTSYIETDRIGNRLIALTTKPGWWDYKNIDHPSACPP